MPGKLGFPHCWFLAVRPEESVDVIVKNRLYHAAHSTGQRDPFILRPHVEAPHQAHRILVQLTATDRRIHPLITAIEEKIVLRVVKELTTPGAKGVIECCCEGQ